MLAFLPLMLVMPASAAGGETLLVSRAAGLAGVGADDDSFNPSISADGRFVSFTSNADNLSIQDNNGFFNFFLRNPGVGATTFVGQNNLTGGNGGSSSSVSADGRFVAFTSDADDLSTEDDNAFENVFVRDTLAGTTTLVSRANGVSGAGANAGSFSPSLSDDGRLVAFVSGADNLSTGDNNSFRNVFVRDLQANTTTLASITFDNTAGANDHAVGPSLSADGRFVAFHSGADNLSDGDNDSFTNVFVRDTVGPGATTLVSRANLAGANDDSSGASLSADGRFVAFESAADNLSDEDDNSFPNIFVRDTLGAGVTTLVSRANGAGGAGANGVFSYGAAISADGRLVAFQSDADNLSDADDNSVSNVFLRDTRGGPPRCSDVVQAVAGTATAVALACADAAGDGDPITHSVIRGPEHGTLGAIDQAAGTVTYTPNQGYSGPDSFSFRALDAAGASATATASLTVAGAGPGDLLPGRCANLLRGTNRGETLTGTRAGDRILGLGGSDVLSGQQGDDCLSGGRGNDRLAGGRANDRLTGGPGNDRLNGGSGNDRLSGSTGKDKLKGGSGKDRLIGGKARDSFDGAGGNDRINSADGKRERVRCGKGTDKVTADEADKLSGCERVRRV